MVSSRWLYEHIQHIPAFLGQLLVQRALSGNIHHQPCVCQWADYAAPSPRSFQRDNKKPPPLAQLTEIIRMSGIAPQFRVQHLSALGEILLETTELIIANSLEEKPEAPQAHTHQRKCPKSRRIAGDHGQLLWQRQHPNYRALQQENLA